jgi:hypothetical protein
MSLDLPSSQNIHLPFPLTINGLLNLIKVSCCCKIAIEDTLFYLCLFVNAKEIRALIQVIMAWKAMPKRLDVAPIFPAPPIFLKVFV